MYSLRKLSYTFYNWLSTSVIDLMISLHYRTLISLAQCL